MLYDAVMVGKILYKMFNYRIYFRLRRGGTGIPFALARSEFVTVFKPFGLTIKREHGPKRRLWIQLDLPPKCIKQHARNLAYTEAIISQQIEPYGNEPLKQAERKRWYTGWIRHGDQKIYQQEVYVQNIPKRRREAPDLQPFEIYKNEQIISAKGYHTRRALSALDARYLFNIAHLNSNAILLDPFAGFGGIIREAHRRNIAITALDNDPTLAPGLRTLTKKHYAIADAQTLPITSNSIDTIITEPPFHPKYQQAVTNALPELLRVLKPDGKLIILIAQNMLKNIQTFFTQTDWTVTHISTIPRDHGLQCPVLKIRHSSKLGNTFSHSERSEESHHLL